MRLSAAAKIAWRGQASRIYFHLSAGLLGFWLRSRMWFLASKTLTNVMFSGTARFGRLLSGSIGSPDHLVALTSNHMTAQGENWGSNSASWLSFITLG